MKSMIPDSATVSMPPVRVVVPIFRNLSVTRACLESLLNSNLPKNASITIINDCSPEKELSDYCQEISTRGSLNLLVNDHNLGFVKSANKGFMLDLDADIVLLNSDTVVPKNWLQRMQACAYKATDNGTVTPFTNNGTICSYPVFEISNPLPENWTIAELDQAFQSANAGASREIPTAVGFCMYIKRACLNETGPFDESNFGHGYGEECDFSMRASALGWKHIVAADVFVYHEGGASFASESLARKSLAEKVMDTLHPTYQKLVIDFVYTDPLYEFRKNVDAVRLRERPTANTTVLEEHSHYTGIILERATRNYRAMLFEQQQRRVLEQTLNDSRKQFAETDCTLKEVRQAAIDAQLYIDHLREYITSMEQSRSWRYTAWLRRK